MREIVYAVEISGPEGWSEQTGETTGGLQSELRPNARKPIDFKCQGDALLGDRAGAQVDDRIFHEPHLNSEKSYFIELRGEGSEAVEFQDDECVYILPEKSDIDPRVPTSGISNTGGLDVDTLGENDYPMFNLWIMRNSATHYRVPPHAYILSGIKGAYSAMTRLGHGTICFADQQENIPLEGVWNP